MNPQILNTLIILGLLVGFVVVVLCIRHQEKKQQHIIDQLQQRHSAKYSLSVPGKLPDYTRKENP